MNNQPPQPAAIPVIFVNGYTARALCAAALPALPHPGDDVYLGDLAYQVTGHDWMLTPDGQLRIHVRLLPQVNDEGERRFSSPEESRLPAIWGAPPAPPETVL